MFDNFWGDHVDGKLTKILETIHEDNKECWVKVLPLNENGKYGSPQLLLSEKPSKDCLDRIREEYSVRIFQSEDSEDCYNYLMVIETLRFAYERVWHVSGDIPKTVTHNKWDFDGYFYVTDALNEYSRIVIVPYKSNTDFDSGDNLHEPEAERLVKAIVMRLNNGELFQ